MIEMTIDSIRVSMMNYQRVVILKEKVDERYLPIWIGPAEADAIAVKLQGVNIPRPLTHDLLHSVIDTLGATINSIIVSDLKNDTFYAKIILNVDGGQMEVDSRPSDALALAVRSEAPIYAEEVVLDKASIFLDKETGKPVSPENEMGGAGGRDKQVSEDEIGRMSAFTDFINTLDLEDFDKRKS
ncbi:bifunctional nuclease family protein [Chloroflexota bacterium]